MNTRIWVCTLIALAGPSSIPVAGQAVPAGRPQPMQQAAAAVDTTTGMPPGLIRQPGVRRAIDAPVEIFDVGAALPRPAGARQAPSDQVAEVGYVEEIALAAFDAPTWFTAADGGRVWTIELKSAGTCGMRARLHGRWPSDLELRVYDPVSGAAFGPYGQPRLDANQEWWTTLIVGDAVGLEFYRPPTDEVADPEPLPKLTAVAKHWAADHGNPCDSLPLSCGHADIMCSPAWVFAGRAVARYQYIENGGCFVCTGALINRSPSDLAPLFLTADHCIDTQATANTMALIWFYQNDACDGSIPTDPNLFPRTDGALLLKTRNNSDTSLLGLFEPPNGDVWLGWNSGGWLLQSDATGIHHPAGNAKRISFGDVTAALFVSYGQNDAHVWRVDWDTGSTEGGSSGSPVLDDASRIRGQLKGGPGCGTSDYGRFGVSYDTHQPYIDGMASPVFAQAGAGGDQLGTSGNPFNTVYEATFCVFAGDEVRIRAGNYNEAFRIWRPMTLNAENGVARIGAP